MGDCLAEGTGVDHALAEAKHQQERVSTQSGDIAKLALWFFRDDKK
jgi:hypothetical protein